MADPVAVVVIAGQHSFFGGLENRGLRVLEVLNDVSSNYLQLHDVTLRRGLDGMSIGQLPKATIPKTAIDFVLLEQDHHEAPLRRKYSLLPKDSREALVLLGDYEIRGTFMISGTFDVLPSLRQEPTAFFPVASARLTHVSGDSPITAGVAFINGLKTTLLHLTRQAVASAS